MAKLAPHLAKNIPETGIAIAVCAVTLHEIDFPIRIPLKHPPAFRLLVQGFLLSLIERVARRLPLARAFILKRPPPCERPLRYRP